MGKENKEVPSSRRLLGGEGEGELPSFSLLSSNTHRIADPLMSSANEESSPTGSLLAHSRRLTPTSLLAQTLQTNQSPGPSPAQPPPPPPPASLPLPSAVPPRLLMAGGQNPSYKSSSSAGSSSTLPASGGTVAGPSLGGAGGSASLGGAGAPSTSSGGKAGASKKSRQKHDLDEGDGSDNEDGDGKRRVRKRIERACL